MRGCERERMIPKREEKKKKKIQRKEDPGGKEKARVEIQKQRKKQRGSTGTAEERLQYGTVLGPTGGGDDDTSR